MTLTQALERISFLEEQVDTLNKIVDGKKAKKRDLKKSRSEYYKALRDRRRENGLCTVCGKKLPEGTEGVRCIECYERAREYEREQRAIRAAQRREKKIPHVDDEYAFEEANICLTCDAEKCTGNCKRFKEAKNKLEVGDER